MRIVEACTINRTLHKLVYTHNNLLKSGLAAVNEYIRKENVVQIFDASWNSIIASSIQCTHKSLFIILHMHTLTWSPDGWKFAYCMQVCLINKRVWNDNIQCNFTDDSLIELNFLFHSIPSYLLVDIVQRVMEIDTLPKLTIPSNRISDYEAMVFIECLKTNTTLIELDLSGNYITHKRASAIVEAFIVNNTLQKLIVSSNRISDDGAISFIDCLKTNTTLIELGLSGNIITDKEASAIAEALIVNNALQSHLIQ